MLVELDDEHTKCSICNTEFSCDKESQDPEIRQHLPVLSSSQRCDHWFCHGCILREQQRVAQEENIDGKVPKWIKCMHCREKTSFNPAEPMYHRLLIDLLARAQNISMIVELNEEHTKCSICTTNFSSDRDNKDPDIRQHLPVLSSSQRCDHWFCHGCVFREQLRVAEGNKGRVPKWIKCMHCREKTSFNPAEPKYHRLLIDLLARGQEQKKKMRKKEKELKKKLNEEVNNFLSAWLLRPENVHMNPIAAATPTAEAKEWMAKHLRVDRARIDSWFYRKRKKLKKQHMPETEHQARNRTITTMGNIPQPHPQNQAIPASEPSIVKPLSAPQNQLTINQNVNLPSNNQMPQNQIALTASTQVSVSVNQQLPSNEQSRCRCRCNKCEHHRNAVGESTSTGVIPSKRCGLSEDAKQFLIQWLLKTSNPYPSKEMKDKVMAHFGVTNMRTLDWFLTRTRKKLHLQNKQSFINPAQESDEDFNDYKRALDYAYRIGNGSLILLIRKERKARIDAAALRLKLG